MTREKSYVAIDLKSFYASVECVERGLDPLNTNLVVADERRSGEDDLPGGLSFAEAVWHSRPSPSFRSHPEGEGDQPGP